jgi:hypothetical protein
LGGIAAAGATGYGVYQVGKALFQAKAIIGTVSASMATTTAASGGLAAAFSGLASFLTGPLGATLAIAIAALASFEIGVDAAYKAVTDFSDYLDRQNKARTQKEERALGAMFEALAAKNINISVISTSEIKISVLIAEEYLELAVRALHAAFEMEHA